MYLAYFDESGDSGLKNSPTQWFVLSCVLIHQARWMESLNQLVKARRTQSCSRSPGFAVCPLNGRPTQSVSVSPGVATPPNLGIC